MTPPNAPPTTIGGDKNREGKPETMFWLSLREVLEMYDCQRVMQLKEAEFWKLIRGGGSRSVSAPVT